jgi:hypothetical protein
MNRAQVVELLAYAAACDQRTIGDADVLVWHDILAPLDYETCRTAMRQHYRRQPDVRLKPGHLWQACATRTDVEAAVQHDVDGALCSGCKAFHHQHEPCTVLVPIPPALASAITEVFPPARLNRPGTFCCVRSLSPVVMT